MKNAKKKVIKKVTKKVKKVQPVHVIEIAVPVSRKEAEEIMSVFANVLELARISSVITCKKEKSDE